MAIQGICNSRFGKRVIARRIVAGAKAALLVVCLLARGAVVAGVLWQSHVAETSGYVPTYIIDNRLRRVAGLRDPRLHPYC